MTYIPPNVNGQATMANSSPVVIASDQSAVPISSATLATTAKQDLLLTELQLKADLTETQPVSAASLPLPAGASTSALQTTGNTSLSSIDTKTPALGQALAATSVPVILPAATVTTLTPPAAITGFALEATLTSIKDTAGIKKITDPLPAGTNNIGDVDVLTVNGVAPAFGTGLRAATVQRVTVATDDLVPVSAASLPLPTGAATSANQTTLGSQTTKINDGTNTAAVKAASTAAAATDPAIVVAISPNNTVPVSAASLPLPSGAATSALQSTQDTSINTLLKPANTLAGVTTVSTVTNLAQMAGAAIAMGTGVRAAGVQRVTIATDDLVPVSAASLPLPSGAATSALQSTQDTSINTLLKPASTLAALTTLNQMNGQAISMGTGVRAAGTQRVTIATDDVVPASQSGSWTVQPGNTQNTTEWLVIDKATTAGGLSKFHLVGAGTTNATNIKASAGQVYSITAFNIAATPVYIKFHNTAGTPTAGTAVTDTFLIPGNTSGTGMVINFDKGVAFSTGIGITTVTGITDASAVAIAADNLVLQVYYK